MKHYIRDMVSQRCKITVTEEFIKMGLQYLPDDAGSVEIGEYLTPEQQFHLKANLLKSGFELLENKKSILIERIKNVIVEMIYATDDYPIKKYSDFISEKLRLNYTYLANIFSEAEGLTLQQYIINHKIKFVKELLLDYELSLTAISCKLHYSSLAHLSTQFKKATGLSPSVFREQNKSISFI